MDAPASVATPSASTDPIEAGQSPSLVTLLVDRQGRVAWRGSGPFDAQMAADLARRMREPLPLP